MPDSPSVIGATVSRSPPAAGSALPSWRGSGPIAASSPGRSRLRGGNRGFGSFRDPVSAVRGASRLESVGDTPGAAGGGDAGG
jgi:hypothetical protein